MEGVSLTALLLLTTALGGAATPLSVSDSVGVGICVFGPFAGFFLYLLRSGLSARNGSSAEASVFHSTAELVPRQFSSVAFAAAHPPSLAGLTVADLSGAVGADAGARSLREPGSTASGSVDGERASPSDD